MGDTTAIEWADHTFNPWAGCTKVSPACANCYAEKSPGSVFRGVKWGPKAERVVSADSTWRKPLAWNRKAEREGTSPRVFCGSLCDVLEARDDLDEHRARLWELIEQTPHLTWLLLTKRPEEVLRRVPVRWSWTCPSHGRDIGQPIADRGEWHCGRCARPLEQASWPANVWIGATVEDQQRADERIPHLLRIPAPVRFLSCEPLLGPVLLDNGDTSWLTCNGENKSGSDEHVCCMSEAEGGACFHGIDWVITGGESGPKARPSHPDWFRSLRDQCQAAGVPFFLKQWGEWAELGPDAGPDCVVDRSGRVVQPWTAEGFPPRSSSADGWQRMYRVGKKAAGALLDGREWRELPGREG